MFLVDLGGLFYFDRLTIVMLSAVLFIGCIIWFNAKRYMHGDRYKEQLLSRIIQLIIAVSSMVVADNVVIFCAGLIVSNFLLIKLMLHKREWAAAKSSAVLASKYLSVSCAFIVAGFIILGAQKSSFQIQEIILSPHSVQTTVGLCVIFIGVMLQSALWPFHKWLLSSLTSPTPVSAMMHAGVINGAGFMLIRLSPLYNSSPGFLNLIFIIGLISSLVGTAFKLVQNDYKRMLASSTMGQMGFMIMQCGLGLYSAAIAHLCWHAIFKAYLFLAAGSAAQEHSETGSEVNIGDFLLAILIGGLLGTYIFRQASGHMNHMLDTTLFLDGVVFITATQLVMTILSSNYINKVIIATIASISLTSVYGTLINISEHFMLPVNSQAANSLNTYHVLGFSGLLLAWLFLTFRNKFIDRLNMQYINDKAYVALLNASQPHSSTVTTARRDYYY